MAATPGAPVTTVGGNGRAVVVVDDNMAQNADAPPSQDHTSIAVGMAEPGRDIFAAQPKKEVKSEDPSAAPPAEEKDISTVGLQSSSTASQSESTGSERSSSGVDTVSAGSSQNQDANTDAHKPEGPLPEAEAEASRVAKELYADEVD